MNANNKGGEGSHHARIVELRPPWSRLRQVLALILACALLTLVAATCWSWERQRVDLLTLEQSLDAMSQGKDATAQLVRTGKRIVRELKRAASGTDNRAINAREFLKQLQDEITR